MTLTLFSGTRYSIGWYVARMNSMISAATVLAVLLYEIRICTTGLCSRNGHFVRYLNLRRLVLRESI
ncbi:MASE4 domain-containing protein [Paenibacillus sp. N3.4]|uniref:MASE4 domain-containing protein n=1 Tax=Paenibacillus sp. N3.4 TaxID=2603222 RepID=UPI00164F1E2B